MLLLRLRGDMRVSVPRILAPPSSEDIAHNAGSPSAGGRQTADRFQTRIFSIMHQHQRREALHHLRIV